MELNLAQRTTINALADVGGWATMTQIVKRGGHFASVDYLVKSGHIKCQTITPKIGHPLVEYRVAIL